MPADPTPAERREEAEAIADALLALPPWKPGDVGWSHTRRERVLAAAVRDLADENERLRDEVDALTRVSPFETRPPSPIEAERDVLREQRDLFGHLLTRIVEHYGHPAEDFINHDVQCARAALAEPRA